MTRPSITFAKDAPTLAEVIEVVAEFSTTVFGGRYPVSVVADAETVKAWMVERGSADAEAALAGRLWTHLLAAPIEAGHPVSILWEAE
jgi:hypothetical protein